MSQWWDFGAGISVLVNDGNLGEGLWKHVYYCYCKHTSPLTFQHRGGRGIVPRIICARLYACRNGTTSRATLAILDTSWENQIP